MQNGAPGEIVGLGPMLISGYHGNGAASAEATWTDAQGEKWLRTGDLGRLDEEGFLYVVDRKKDMILSGGQNISQAQALIDWTNARVGKQQRIRAVVPRPTLPRNANGKVLKRELRRELAHLVF